MKCKHCGEKIPRGIVIDGKKRSLSNRKYCLNCHPFEAAPKGRKMPKIPNKEGLKCICKLCGKKYKYSRKKGHLLDFCVGCKQRKQHRKMKQKAVEYKGGKCKKCGYDKCLQALDFHHRDPKDKTFSIAKNGLRFSWDRLKREIDKCDLVCANCHREIEYDGGARLV